MRWLLIAMVCLPAAASAQQVICGDANLLHRAPLRYPEEALQLGIEGTLVVDATLNERGLVTDAHVVSGPQLLRKAALQSILDWHYVPGTPSPVEIALEFKTPPRRASLLNGQPVPAGVKLVSQPVPQRQNWDVGILKGIQFINLSPATREAILSRLPIREGDSFQGDAVKQIDQILRDVDEHLTAKFQMLDFDGERRLFTLRISYADPVEVHTSGPSQ